MVPWSFHHNLGACCIDNTISRGGDISLSANYSCFAWIAGGPSIQPHPVLLPMIGLVTSCPGYGIYCPLGFVMQWQSLYYWCSELWAVSGRSNLKILVFEPLLTSRSIRPISACAFSIQNCTNPQTSSYITAGRTLKQHFLLAQGRAFNRLITRALKKWKALDIDES